MEVGDLVRLEQYIGIISYIDSRIIKVDTQYGTTVNANLDTADVDFILSGAEIVKQMEGAVLNACR